jgi:hypothetical protein
MNKTEQRFLTLVRSNNMRSYHAAHRVIDKIGTPVLYVAARELVSRAKYLYMTDTPEKADYANQLANQIAGVLHGRDQNVAELNAKINENAQMF